MPKKKEEERQEKEALPYTMYTFVYEQHFDNGTWGPNTQHIRAKTSGDAFATLGFVIDVYKLIVRNVNYGLWSEMREEDDRVSDYWSDYWSKEKIKKGQL